MSTERAARLRDAEKLLRQDKLDEAIAEYRALVEAQPSDWNTANILGDLYLRAGASDKAVEQFVRIADAYLADGFLPKAAALYRKILKAAPAHEYALLKTADIAVAQGRVGDARTALEQVRAKRRERGDEMGLAEVDERQAALNPEDFAARHRGALARIKLGNIAAGVQDIKVLAAELTGRDRRDEAVDIMREALAFAPADLDLRLAAVEGELRDGRVEAALTHADAILNAEPGRWLQVGRLAAAAHATARDGSQRLARLVADRAIGRQDWEAAMAVLQDALSRTPRQLPLLEPLAVAARAAGAADVLVDALDQIADIRLGTADAEAPLEELVTLQPGEPRHEARLRQVRVMLGRAAPVSPPPVEHPAPGVEELRVAGPHDEPEEVDLSVALDEILPADPFTGFRSPAPASDNLDDVFAAFRDEASRQLVVDVSEQEFARGSALFAAGRIDEAIPALEIASRAPRRRFETASRLARAFRDRGDINQAIEWFERASEAPAPQPDAAHAVLYDLASTLEGAGETARALAIYLELQADCGVYRDVEARVARLMRIESGE